MIVKMEKSRPPYGRFAGKRRTGIDRRGLTYDRCIPERRATDDRRQDGKYAGGSHAERFDCRRYA